MNIQFKSLARIPLISVEMHTLAKDNKPCSKKEKERMLWINPE